MKKVFYGWWVTAAAFVSLGMAVGLPYYNISFFYDYFEKTFGWSKSQITFGFPLASLPTLFIAPMFIHRFSPRKLILFGTAMSCLALVSFGLMGPSIGIYWGIWFVYILGYISSGPIPHQVIISQWFRRKRGTAMGLIYVGIGVFGLLGSYLVKPLAEDFGFRTALMILGAMLFLSWPLVILVIRNQPSEMGLFADGDAVPSDEVKRPSHTFRELMSRYPFWLLLIGSFCSVAAISSVNFHMKFVFEDHMDPRVTDPVQFQHLLNSTWRAASMIILASSIAGRVVIGGLADYMSKKWVMTATYFVVAATIPMMLVVKPPETPWMFGLLFGIGMGADYMLIPLMAAEQFGVNSLARAMAVILPANTIGQTWFPYFVSLLREHYGHYQTPMMVAFATALIGAACILLLPRQAKRHEAFPLPNTRGTAAAR